MSEYEELLAALAPPGDHPASATVSIERKASINYQGLQVMVSTTIASDVDSVTSGTTHEVASAITRGVLHDIFDETLFPEFEAWARSIRS